MKLTEQDIRIMVSESVKKILKENVETELQAWHGSAADFDAFDLNFIGTGEGTQAYGYGIYVTGVKETGKESLQHMQTEMYIIPRSSRLLH